MITLVLPNPNPTLVEGVRYLSSIGGLMSYHVTMGKSDYKEANIIFTDYKSFRYIVALLDEAEFFKKES